MLKQMTTARCFLGFLLIGVFAAIVVVACSRDASETEDSDLLTPATKPDDSANPIADGSSSNPVADPDAEDPLAVPGGRVPRTGPDQRRVIGDDRDPAERPPGQEPAGRSPDAMAPDGLRDPIEPPARDQVPSQPADSGQHGSKDGANDGSGRAEQNAAPRPKPGSVSESTGERKVAPDPKPAPHRSAGPTASTAPPPQKTPKEKPAKEKPAKEKPAKEKPAKEKPAKEKPAEDATAAESQTDLRKRFPQIFSRRGAGDRGATTVLPLPPEDVVPPMVAMTDGHRRVCLVGVKDRMPDFNLPDPSQNLHQLVASMGTELTVVLFWNSSNVYAVEQFSRLKREVGDSFSGRGVQCVAIYVGEPTEETVALLHKYGDAALCLIDKDQSYFQKVATRKLPRTYLLDEQGNILWFDIEYSSTSRKSLQNALRYYLEGPAPKTGPSQQ